MKTINPTRQNLIRFMDEAPADTPIVMVNLLKFREQAAYPPGSKFQACSGRQAYRRYTDLALKKLGEVGARPVWMSRALMSLIAPDDEEWDEVLLVRYPSAEAFLRMIGMPDYLAASVHREAALEDSRLIPTIELLSEMGSSIS